MVDCARTAEPVEPGCANGVSWEMCVTCGAGGACTVGGGWDGCGNPTLREATGFSCDGTLVDLLGLLNPPLLLCACDALLKNTLKVEKISKTILKIISD